MAPSAKEVTDLFLSLFDPKELNTKNFENALAKNHKLHVSGRDFVCGGSSQTLEEFTANYVTPISNAFEKSKSMKVRVVRVILSSDSPWVAVETEWMATTKKGKPWRNEGVTLLCFEDGKISEMKIYIDTQHVHDHVMDHS